jgi:putative transposase
VREAAPRLFYARAARHCPVLEEDGIAVREKMFRRYDFRRCGIAVCNCLDNAAMESFFGTLKAEFFYLQEFTSVDQLNKQLRSYIRYYNHDRLTLKLKELSPVQ